MVTETKNDDIEEALNLCELDIQFDLDFVNKLPFLMNW